MCSCCVYLLASPCALPVLMCVHGSVMCGCVESVVSPHTVPGYSLNKNDLSYRIRQGLAKVITLNCCEPGWY